MGPRTRQPQNAKLLAYFKDRTAWLVEPDNDNTELTPYSPPEPRIAEQGADHAAFQFPQPVRYTAADDLCFVFPVTAIIMTTVAKTTGLNSLPNIPDVPPSAEVRAAGPASSLSKISTGKLLQVLGVWFGIAAAVGNTIAAGIVRTPGVIAKLLPNPWFFLGVWVIGGLYALFGASSMAELGAAIPRSGGQYNFSRRAIGDYAGFIVGWSDWLSSCGTLAAVAIVIGEYSGKLIPALDGGDKTIKTIAVSVIVGFGILQWRGVRWGSRAQLLTSAMKTAAFVILVIACFALRWKLPSSLCRSRIRNEAHSSLRLAFGRRANARSSGSFLHHRRLGRRDLFWRRSSRSR